jgi:outer membrane lipoprotein-sorting protein
MLRPAAAVLFLAAAAFGPSAATRAAPPGTGQIAQAGLSEQDKADIARIEAYLNSIRTLRSRFLQASPDGSLARGTFYMHRPGRMRIEYDPPIGNYIVADGWFIHFWDAELRQQSNAPIGSTMAELILRDDLLLSGAITVNDVQRGPGRIEVELIETRDPAKGRLTLVFEDSPLQLRKWRVLDAQGLTTEVALLDPQFGMPLDRRLFTFVSPDFGRFRGD